MFDGSQLFDLSQVPVLSQLASIEDSITKRLFKSESAARALVLSVLSGDPLLLIGPPGTAKSRLVRLFCHLSGVLKQPPHEHGQTHGGLAPVETSPDYFEYLLTRYTEPSELFGPWDIPKLRGKKVMERVDARSIQRARVVFLDEVFNASSAILNTLLTFMNERLFHDAGKVFRVNTECIFGATNRAPETATLRAVYDRFLLRCHMASVSVDGGQHHDLSKMLDHGWRDLDREFPASVNGNLFDGLAEFRREFKNRRLLVDAHAEAYSLLADLTARARALELGQLSNRRLVKMVRIMALNRIYEGHRSKHKQGDFKTQPIRIEEFQLIPRYFLDEEADAQQMDRFERCIAAGLRDST